MQLVTGRLECRITVNSDVLVTLRGGMQLVTGRLVCGITVNSDVLVTLRVGIRLVTGRLECGITCRNFEGRNALGNALRSR